MPIQTPANSAQLRPLILRLVKAGIVAPSATWTRLGGGRTNTVFKIADKRETLVCKLFTVRGESPLFANAPRLEWRSMARLAPTGLAPVPIAMISHGRSACILYRYVAGFTPAPDNPAIPGVLARLHSLRPGSLPLPQTVALAPALAMNLPTIAAAASLSASSARRIRSSIDLAREPFKARLTHGDPVTTNLVLGRHGAMLIDWQCPSYGDPCRDISIALSPAMHHVYGAPAMSQGAQEAFLDAYGCPDTTKRYRAMAPALHLQIMAHCAWKAARGLTAYSEAFHLEKGALLRSL